MTQGSMAFESDVGIWDTIPDLITKEMRIHTVTVWAPTHDIEEGQYHWSAVRRLARSLVNGGIDCLRVCFAKEFDYKTSFYYGLATNMGQVEHALRQGVNLPPDGNLPRIYAISRICNPNIIEVENESFEVFMGDYLDPYCSNDDVFREMWEEFWQVEKGKLPYQFGLRREDHEGGGEGTVIVITRP
ncbi:MAG: hypothetical protein Q9174_004231 [Haloplaca sp. 1 TL-2023]